jgi:hypothetical protein
MEAGVEVRNLPESDGRATPGPRTRVILDVAEASLELLTERGLSGLITFEREEPEGMTDLPVYTLHAVSTVGEERDTAKWVGPPAVDVLRELLNEYAEAMDNTEGVPPEAIDLWDRMVDKWSVYTEPENDR